MIVHRKPAAVRVAHGRVLLRVIGGQSYDLTGAAAAVWIAADDPADEAELALRLRDSGVEIDDLPVIVDELLSAGLLVESAGGD